MIDFEHPNDFISPRTRVINDGVEIRSYPPQNDEATRFHAPPSSTIYFYLYIYIYISFYCRLPNLGDGRPIFFSLSSPILSLRFFARKLPPPTLPSPRCCSRKARHELTQKRTDRLSASVIYFANEPVHGGISCLWTKLYIYIVYIYI